MKYIFLNKILKNYLLMMIAIVSVEIIFRLIGDASIFNWSLLRIFLSSNIIALLLSVLFSFFGRIASNILSFISITIFSIYGFAQLGFENYLGVYISITASEQAVAVTNYFNDYLNSLEPIFFLVFIPLFIVLLYYVIFERFARTIIKNKRYNVLDVIGGSKLKDSELKSIKYKERSVIRITGIIACIAIIVFSSVFYYSLVSKSMQNDLQLVDNKSLFNDPDLPSIAVNQFGVIMYGFLDLRTTIVPDDELLGDYELTKPEIVATDYTRYIDDEMWESILASETNETYKKLHTYYLNKDVTSKNDYTGVLEDKNLIVIMMESVNNIIINEEFFPNMYNIYSEGWSWDNAYSPRNSCATGNNEISGMMGLYTVYNTCTANYNKGNEYFTSIFNLFNRSGYETSSYHNYIDAYYDRKTIHSNMGSDIYYNTNDLAIDYDIVYEEWPSDDLLMSASLEKFIDQDQFMVWLTTVTPHQPYHVSSEFGDKHLDLFIDTDYSMSLKRYMSKLKEFDIALGSLMDGLDDAGKLDDTVIVLYADHYPYGMSNNTLNQYFEYDVSVNKEVDRTPFVIYNSTLKPAKYDDYTSLMNLTPTLANLFDLNYDPRLYSGIDLFSEDNNDRVIFADGSWQDDIAFYNAAYSSIEYFGAKEYTNEEIIEINSNIYEEIKMANLAITSGYHEYLGHKLASLGAPIITNQ